MQAKHPSYPESTSLTVRNKFWENAPQRNVTVENGGIRCKDEWFEWDYFFQVNTIVHSVVPHC